MRPLLFLITLSTALAQTYSLGPDSQRKEGIPKGAVTKHSFVSSKLYPGTTRDYWVYVPAQYDPAKPAALMVFQDGGGYATETGAWRVPIVFDNLIAQGAMPVTIAVMANPGVLLAQSPNQQSRFNRSFEYDALGDRYVRFLIEELLPEVAKDYKFSSNPDDRAIAGSSSGGIAAFVAAWERPEAFHRVLSFIGSFTNLRGADVLPDLIRKMEPKPLRVFLQDGSNDQNIYGGNWFLANQEMFSALQYAGYETTFAQGTEGHNSRHGGAIFPDALRWLWKDYPKPIARPTSAPGARNYLMEILDPAADWEVVSQGHKFTEGPAVDRDGNVYFADAGANKIFKAGIDGKVALFQDNTRGATGLMFGPDGRLYATGVDSKRVVAYTPEGREAVIAEGVPGNDLAVTSKGAIYVTESAKNRVWYIDPHGRKRIAFEGEIGLPNGVRLMIDESLLLVADTISRWVWSFQVQPDGSLVNAEAFYHLEIPDSSPTGPPRSGADGMTLDSEAHLYVATRLGIQVCDQAGRVVGIIRKPDPASDPSNAVFGGAGLEYLYVTQQDKLWRRHLHRKGVLPWTPAKPPMPRL